MEAQLPIPPKPIPPKPLTYNGVTYPSQAECCRRLGVEPWKVRKISNRKHCSFVDALDEALHSKPFFEFFDCRGKKHKSTQKAIAYYGWIKSRVYNLKQPNEHIHDTIDRILSDTKLFEDCRKSKTGVKYSAAKPCVYDGVSYSSRQACCRALNISQSSVSAYQSKYNVSFEEAVRYKVEHREPRFVFTDVMGVKHNTIADATFYYDIDYTKLSNFTVRNKKLLNFTSMRDTINFILVHPEYMERFKNNVDGPENLDDIIDKKADKIVDTPIATPIATPVAEPQVEQSTIQEDSQVADEPEVIEQAVEQPIVQYVEPTAPLVEIAKETEPETATLNIVDLDFSKNTKSFMVELLDVWTGLIRKHWLGEELMCDEWRENFREFEHDLQELGYTPDKRILRRNTNRMWRKDNIKVVV